MFHKQKQLCNNLFMWRPGCNLACLKLCVCVRACVRACVCVCVFWREGGDTSLTVQDFFFFSLFGFCLFLIRVRGLGFCGEGERVTSDGQARRSQEDRLGGPRAGVEARSLEPPHLALLLAGRVVLVGSRLCGLLPKVWLQWGRRPRAETSRHWPGQLSFHPAPAPATLAKREGKQSSPGL